MKIKYSTKIWKENCIEICFILMAKKIISIDVPVGSARHPWQIEEQCHNWTRVLPSWLDKKKQTYMPISKINLYIVLYIS